MDEKKDRRHWTISSYDENGVPIYSEKKAIATELEAIELCYKLNINGHELHKVAAYKCPVCFQWHIGHTETPLDAKTRSKISQQYKKFKIANS